MAHLWAAVLGFVLAMMKGEVTHIVYMYVWFIKATNANLSHEKKFISPEGLKKFSLRFCEQMYVLWGSRAVCKHCCHSAMGTRVYKRYPASSTTA
jgi:hypothetical protein